MGVDAVAERTTAFWRDYLELCKPKVVLLMILTVLVGMHLAVDGFVPLDILILGNLGIAMASGAAAVVNHCVDKHIDTIMARTQGRPVAKGRIPQKNALIFAFLLAVVAMIILDVFINRLTAVLTLASLVGYAFVYTMYLKRATPQNIVIGGIAGATPPLLGWTAVTGSVHPHALLLVLIIFTWTPPHFWALAIHRKDEYAKAEIPMLPVTHGTEFTATSVLLYSILLAIVTLLPFLTGMTGYVYLVSIGLLNTWFIYHALLLKFSQCPKQAMKTFGISITYLMILFVALLVDHYWTIPGV